MTNSLYVPGKLCDTERVLVDVGTGYFVQKVRCCARDVDGFTQIPVDACTSTKTLHGQGGLHPEERRDPGRDDREEAREHAVPHPSHAGEDTSTGSGSAWSFEELTIGDAD